MVKNITQKLIGERIKYARSLAGLSQGQVAKLMGFHRPTISEIEAGNRKVSAEEVVRFSDLFDVSTAWLLGREDEKLATDDPRLELAARELAKIGSEDLDKLLTLLAAMRDKPDSSGGGQE